MAKNTFKYPKEPYFKFKLRITLHRTGEAHEVTTVARRALEARTEVGEKAVKLWSTHPSAMTVEVIGEPTLVYDPAKVATPEKVLIKGAA